MKLSIRRRRWFASGAAASAIAAALPLALVASGSTVAGAAAAQRVRLGNGGWAGGAWLSTGVGTTTTGNTLANVRTVINAASGTAASLNGTGVGIALIDTGIAPVPGLPAGQLVHGPDLSFESQSSQLRYMDTYGHGTHMAGIMVANDTATGTVGLAPKAKVTSVKVGTSNGAVDVSQMIAAIDWVVKNKNHDAANPIRVLNLSYGAGGVPSYLTDPLQYAVEQAWQAGIVVVVAGGNDGNNSSHLTNPATDPFGIAVGASSTKGTTATSDDVLAGFSNSSIQTRKLDLVAPGEAILSLRVGGSYIDENYTGARVGETLFRGSGSSQAAAVTSAAVALLLQNRPTLTPDQVKRILIDSGTLLQATATAPAVRQLNLGAALARTTPTTTQTFTKGNGTGSIEAARGNSHVARDGVELKGDSSIFGPFSSSTWASKAAARTSWSGGLWMGYRMAGDGWTGAPGTVGTGQISGHAGKCVDINAANTANGTAVQLWDCNDTGAQYWSLPSDGTIRAYGKCMDLTNNVTASGTKIQLYDCNGTSAQKWTVNSSRQIIHTASGKCLDVTDGSTANGARLQIWECHGGENQRWMPPFASRTWAGATWPGRPWSGATSWVDPDWSGRYWSGRYWSGRYWSGRYWSTDDWSSSFWG